MFVHQGCVAGWRLDQRHGQKEGVEHPQQSALSSSDKMTCRQQRHQQQEQQHRLRCEEVPLHELPVHILATSLDLHLALKRHEFRKEIQQFAKTVLKKPGVGSLKTPETSRVDEPG